MKEEGSTGGIYERHPSDMALKQSSHGAPFSGFVIALLRYMLIGQFFLLVLAGTAFGYFYVSASTELRADNGPAVVGAIIGFSISTIYAVLVTGFGFVLLDIRRLLKKQVGEL